MTAHSEIELFRRARGYGPRPALQSAQGALRYEELLAGAESVARALVGEQASLDGARIAFLCPPGLDYVRVQWGTWLAGGVAVPLCPLHPEPELEYAVADAGAQVVVAHPSMAERLEGVAERLGCPLRSATDLHVAHERPLPGVRPDDPAMILYTSGTTGRPKGVLTSHRTIQAQIEALVEAWEWTGDDRILCVLPLHHLHGIINVLGSALYSGACCVLHESFDADLVWESFERDDLTLFMAVPTIYRRLIAAHDGRDSAEQTRQAESCRRMRLMVSGSAALPVTTLERWREISGHTLLERYGMTETGMILSNPLHGPRCAGAVGVPLPGTEVRMVGDDGAVVGPGEGEIHVRGDAVFSRYWRREEETRQAFDDSWFKTGDIARFDGETYRLLGRTSVDIIKTGGYKVSALEIEEVLRSHPRVGDCAVVGVPDDDWGERVSAAFTCEGDVPEEDELRLFAKQSLAAYKVPRTFVRFDELPRNALGKVTKPAVKDLFAKLEESGPELS